MSVDCSSLFPKSHLHLLVWDRFNTTAHDDALRLLAAVLADTALGRRVLPLLRPLGRPASVYRGYDSQFAEHSADNGLPPVLPGHPGGYLACCETWLQVNPQSEEALWRLLGEWAEDGRHSPARVWRSHPDPLWQPLATGLADCEYANARHSGAVIQLAQLAPESVAWLLKTIWHRASTEIVRDCVTPGAIRRFDPCTQQTEIASLLGRVLAPIGLADWGITSAPDVVDASDFQASHLAAFALSAVTAERAPCIYQLEQYWPDPRITHPASYPDLPTYLQTVARARCY